MPDSDRGMLLTVAYPAFSPDDRDRIERIRAAHDPLCALIAAHFTLVYPVPDMTVDEFVADATRQADGTAPISFVLRSALSIKDHVSDGAVVFLVPDEGFGALVRLHDRLAASQRLDLPPIPHITVGRTSSVEESKLIADELNADLFAIQGTITELDVIALEENAVHSVAKLHLR